ncbi:replication initiator protein [Flyfo microvirus Tbat2_156]|nr:replication initiator protein [Flyfo microvirus Tbat2_156]
MPSCLTPIHIKPGKDKPARDGFYYHAVPCGKCAPCRLRRIQGWVFRLRQEEKVHTSSWFVTFTYDQPPLSKAGLMTLCKPDLQNFFKRLRFNTKRKTIKYYACGEYGTNTKRPHYHAILFDATPEEIEKAWLHNPPEDRVKRGLLHFGQVSDDSIAYTAKYMAKESKIPMWQGDDRLPEFSLMSKKLGSNYLTPAIIAYHKESFRSYLTMPGGATHAMPRYYRNRIFEEWELKHMNDCNQEQYDKIFEQNVKDAGGLSNYYRDMHYAIVATNKSFNNADNRKKI